MLKIKRALPYLIAITLLPYFSQATETAQPFYQANFFFSNISFNYLDWTENTTDRSGKRDFTYIEFEGGAGFNWGDIYAFIDFENPGKSSKASDTKNSRRASKIKFGFDVFSCPLKLYFQMYDLSEEYFFVNNRTYGVRYDWDFGQATLFQTFIGVHDQSSTFYSGNNGYMGGWVLNHNFTAAEQALSVSMWHEYEFDRDEEHYLFNGAPTGDGEDAGHNGAIALWWHITDKITTGLQYRYADHKLGYNGYQNGPIASLKFNF